MGACPRCHADLNRSGGTCLAPVGLYPKCGDFVPPTEAPGETLWATEWESHDRWLLTATGIACTCDDHLFSAGTQDCPHHGGENQRAAAREAKYEIDAENAWLRAAELGTLDSWREEEMEREREAFYS